MKKYKILSWIFIAAVVLLSDVMCAAVAFQYCDMLWCIQYQGFSAPASTAFLLAIPFAIGIVVCALLAWFFHKK